jgi:ribosomal-protein-alanine N-acetyltransferase
MSKLIFRKMKEPDLDQVISIENECFSDPWSYLSFKSDIHNEMALPMVLDSDGSIAGYSSIYIVANELQIGNFAVQSKYRGRGAAKLMMEEIIKIARNRGCSMIYLEVRESNDPAIKLYSSFGFRSVGHRKNYYRSPKENAIVMAKEIKWSTGLTVPKKES